ncbi:MAG: DUF1592 domain-containing protein, partial [Verrucomicrobiae bacterium]|nr:DUF1592 domain-containing protein [Verrucomicrobiae bacterium]
QPVNLFPDGNEFKELGPKKWKGPGLAIQRIELEGPLLEEFPSRGHRLIFDGLNRQEVEPENPTTKTKSWYVPKYEIQSEDPAAEAKAVLARVASKAFRRPVDESQIAPYLDLMQTEMKDGSTFEEALKTSVIAIFCAPEFLYFQESSGFLDDWELASRLSYFLCRTAPDNKLLDAARAGKLSKDPGELLAQTERLLAHPHAERFVTDFTDAWLDLRNIEFTAPDARLFPEYDSYLQYSMIEETRSFFRALIQENLSIKNVVKSDFVMLNERLAEHYGI